MFAWSRLLDNPNWCRGTGRFFIPAYSEYLPPPWVGPKPYDGRPGAPPDPSDGQYGWNVSEYEEEQELRPGVRQIADVVMKEVMRLAGGQAMRHIARARLKHNPAWPPALAALAGRLTHERFVLLLSVALSRTQDDKGRVRWTLFGSSEQGPGKPFWRGFFTEPGVEAPRGVMEAFFFDLLRAHGASERVASDPEAAGVRVLPGEHDAELPHLDEGTLPRWARAWSYRDNLKSTKYLLTFRPFERLPCEVQQAYVEGKLHLWPFPGSLAFWHDPRIRQMQGKFPFALQLPLLYLFPRVNDFHGLRIPQSGWLHEHVAVPPELTDSHKGEVKRPHRWEKVERGEGERPEVTLTSPIAEALFSTAPDDIALYNKPMARQAQMWSRDFKLILDGFHDRHARLERAEGLIDEGGTFGYRFIYPPMRVGTHEVYWHLPVLACDGKAGAGPLMLRGPAGYLTAYDAKKPDVANAIELWPRLQTRSAHRAAMELFRHENRPRKWQTMDNVRAILEFHDLLGVQSLTPSFARALIEVPERTKFDDWLGSLGARASDPQQGAQLADRLHSLLGADVEETDSLTFDATATRDFEERYWRLMAELAHGKFVTKCNADCARDEPTRKARPNTKRDLDALARHLVRTHQKLIKESGVEGAWVGEDRFTWRTDFDYPWMGGWRRNQQRGEHERNLLVRIPGRDSTQAVILADHYDTAYMHDRYYLHEGGTGARLAAAGADDNHSATAMLLLAAPILLQLSAEGKLGCDVWLVHLTGEEFPSDCLGARHLSQVLVERSLKVHVLGGSVVQLGDVDVRGVYVSDMIAHNNDRQRDTFQIAPGEGTGSARLAVTAHEANRAWNALAQHLNRKAPRRGCKRPSRREDPADVPGLFPHAVLRGEVRPEWAPRSTLFNTDGQIFSDVGVPVVLFMEDYDINRKGYHDMFDTMGNIDLDYGSALAAIVIETVARAAV